MGKKIFITSIPRLTATGLSDFKDENSGKPLNKTKMGKCADGVRALEKPSAGGYANYISYTPWIDATTGLQKTDADGRLLTLQDQLELKWNKPKGFFTNRAWRPGDSVKDEDMTYFMRKRVKLQDGTTVLDMDNMEDEMSYYILLESKFVANSEKEYRAHKWPSAMWYIALENESDEIKYSKNQLRSKAFAALHAADFDDAMKRKFIPLLGIASSKTTLTDQQVHNMLFDYIEKSTFAPGSNIEKFHNLYALLNTALGREQLHARYILQQALDTRVVYEKQDSYYFNRASGVINIGDRYEEAVDYILSPKKEKDIEEMLALIKERL